MHNFLSIHAFFRHFISTEKTIARFFLPKNRMRDESVRRFPNNHSSDLWFSGPIFMDNLFCDGNEKKLTECHFDGWQVGIKYERHWLAENVCSLLFCLGNSLRKQDFPLVTLNLDVRELRYTIALPRSLLEFVV